jgi:hypothetical protein
MLHCTRARGRVSWVEEWAEGAGTAEVLDGGPGGGREQGGTEGTEAKMGKLESGVHPL